LCIPDRRAKNPLSIAPEPCFLSAAWTGMEREGTGIVLARYVD
jgi:hypothetical protein